MSRRICLRRLVSLTCLAASTLWLASCGSEAKRYPVRGQVFVGGKPAEGAVVVFHAAAPSGTKASSERPAGRVQADGSFTLGTFAPGDGAPEGDYVVAIAWPNDTDPTANVAVSKKATPKLALQYGDARKTPLRAKIVQGSNDIPAFQIAP
jgi:hypothetical protein